MIFETGIRIATFSHRVSARWETNGAHYPVKTWRDHLEFRVHDNNRADTTSGVRAEWIGVGTLDVSFEDGRKRRNVVSILSEESEHREWSTVVDISIPPPSFKHVSLSLSTFSSIQNTQTCIF